MATLEEKIEALLKDPDQTVAEIFAAVEQQLGFVPSILSGMAERPDILIPSVLTAYFLLGEPKALDRKTAELIAFACAVSVRGDACTKVHLQEAQKSDASHQEIFVVVMIASVMAQTAVQASALRVCETAGE